MQLGARDTRSPHSRETWLVTDFGTDNADPAPGRCADGQTCVCISAANCSTDSIKTVFVSIMSCSSAVFESVCTATSLLTESARFADISSIAP